MSVRLSVRIGKWDATSNTARNSNGTCWRWQRKGVRSIAQIERDLDLTAGLIYKWRRRYQVQGERLQPSEERAEQAELRRLKRELVIVKQERDILKKAIQVFSRGEL